MTADGPVTGGAAADPELTVAGWREVAGDARRHMKRNRIGVAAGSFAYRWFLALFPIVIALLGLASLLDIPRHVTVRLIHGVTKALPGGAATVLTSAIDNASRRSDGAVAALVVAGAVALWSATSGMVIVEEGLDMAYEVAGDRSFLAKRLRALPLLAAAVVLGGGASALTVFGPQIGAALRHATPVVGSAFLVVWTIVSWLAAILLIALLFSVIYLLAPNLDGPRGTWRSVAPGTLAATLLWAAISAGFSAYTSISGSYSKTYGAFAGAAILIFWLYLTGLAIFLGGEVNAAFGRLGRPVPSRRSRGRRRPAARASGPA